MNVDKAHEKTDTILQRLEWKINSEYNKAYKEVKKDLTSVLSKLELNQNMSPQQRLTLMNKKDRLESMIEQYSRVLADTNGLAVKYINNDMLNVYKTNYDFEADKFAFAMVDNTAVKKIMSRETNPFTKLSIDNHKDKSQIAYKLRSAMITSILKGESIPEMARRIRGIMENNLSDSIRIARTETTRVENSARMDVGEQGKKLGFKMMKEWVATSDERTRPAHLDADGQQVPIDEPFIVDGEKLMYPGDFSLGASPSNTINCRCTVINIISEDGKELASLELQKEDLESQQKEYKEKMNEKNNKYSNIWKDDVSLNDWYSKSQVSEETGVSPIQSKKEYFENQLDKFNNQLAENPDNEFAQKQVDKFNSLLKDLDDFDKKGEQYYELKQKYDNISNDLKEIKEKIKELKGDTADDAFTQERRDNALWFKSGEEKQADKQFREQAGQVWREATEAEKDAIYDYTRSYHKFNEPLRGYEYGTGSYKGVGNVNMDNIGVSYSGFKKGQVKKEIEDMTNYISKSPAQEDMWVNRGVGYSGMDKFFQVDSDMLRYASDEELMKAFDGVVMTDYGFMSTSSIRSGGFSHNPIIMNIYVPKGSPIAYVEPISAFGAGAHKSWDGISKQSSFGGEFESIIQRGSSYKVTKVERKNGTLYMDLDLIGFDTKPL